MRWPFRLRGISEVPVLAAVVLEMSLVGVTLGDGVAIGGAGFWTAAAQVKVGEGLAEVPDEMDAARADGIDGAPFGRVSSGAL